MIRKKDCSRDLKNIENAQKNKINSKNKKDGEKKTNNNRIKTTI